MTLVLNPYVYNIRMGYLGVVYPIHGQIRDYWRLHYSEYGPPVSNEYSETVNSKTYIVQWFEKSDNTYKKITYDTTDGSFNDPVTDDLSYGDHLDQSLYNNLGCPKGNCGRGGNSAESTVGYTYQSSTVCEDWSHGSSDYWNLKSVGAKKSFATGESVCVLTKIKDVTVDHRWKTEFFRNGKLIWTDESPWQDVEADWDYSSVHPVLRNTSPGDHRVKVWIDSGSGYEKVADKSFTVSGRINFFAGATICEDWEYGSSDHWDLQPVTLKNEFAAGDPVCCLAQVENVVSNHRWKIEFFRNGELIWTDESPWQDVGAGWDYSSVHPVLQNTDPGDYKVKVWFDSGSGYDLKTSKSFHVNHPPLQTLPYEEAFSDSDHGFVLENNNGQGGMREAVIDGRNCLVLENGLSDEQWKVQAKKPGFDITGGTVYNHRITVKASKPGTIYACLQRNVDPWDNFGMWHGINVTTDWQTFSFQFTTSSSLKPEEVRYSIQVGKIAGEIYVDNVKLQRPD